MAYGIPDGGTRSVQEVHVIHLHSVSNLMFRRRRGKYRAPHPVALFHRLVSKILINDSASLSYFRSDPSDSIVDMMAFRLTAMCLTSLEALDAALVPDMWVESACFHICNVISPMFDT